MKRDLAKRAIRTAIMLITLGFAIPGMAQDKSTNNLEIIA